MNTKTLIVWFLLLAAIVLAVAAETSVDNKKEGKRQVEIPTVEGKNDDKDSPNYEVDRKGWTRGGGRGGGWKGGGGRGGGWKGGGGRGGGWKGGGGRGGGGGGGGAELTTEQVNDDIGDVKVGDVKDDISQGVASYGGWGGPWTGGYGGWGGPWRGGYGGWGGPWRGGYGGWGGPWRGGYGGWGPGGGW